MCVRIGVKRQECCFVFGTRVRISIDNVQVGEWLAGRGREEAGAEEELNRSKRKKENRRKR